MRLIHSNPLLVMMLLLLFTISACTGSESDVEKTIANITVGFKAPSVNPRALAGFDQIAYVTLDIQPADVQRSLTDSVDETFSTVVAIPYGNQIFTATAYDYDDEIIGEGESTVTIEDGGPTDIFIYILDTTGPPDVPHSGPLIQAIVASTTAVNVGDPIDLQVQWIAPDPAGPITFQWSDDCSADTFSAPSAESTEWTGVDAGTCNVTVLVSDGELSDQESIEITLFESGTQYENVAVNSSFLPNPYIYYLSFYGGAEPLDIFSFGLYRVSEDGHLARRIAPDPLIHGSNPIVVYGDLVGEGLSSGQLTFSDNCGGVTRDVELNDSDFTVDWYIPPVAEGGTLCTLTFEFEYLGMTDRWDVYAFFDAGYTGSWPPPAD